MAVSKLFEKIISSQQKLPLARKELKAHADVSSGAKDLNFGQSSDSTFKFCICPGKSHG